MHDALPKRIRKYESGIINLDNIKGPGTHWVAYIKRRDKLTYFDSFGNLKPPPKIVNYFNSNHQVDITYNYDLYQFKSYNCGHLCLQFLYNNA